MVAIVFTPRWGLDSARCRIISRRRLINQSAQRLGWRGGLTICTARLPREPGNPVSRQVGSIVAPVGEAIFLAKRGQLTDQSPHLDAIIGSFAAASRLK
jgi:hypothetical protein